MILTLLVAALIAGGCNPSEADGKNVLRSAIKRNGNGLLQLVEFKKLNAIETLLGGATAYELEYECTVRFFAPCKWKHTYPDGSPRFRAETAEDLVYAEGSELIELCIDIRREGWSIASKGSTETLQGTIRFIRTENGWRGPDDAIY